MCNNEYHYEQRLRLHVTAVRGNMKRPHVTAARSVCDCPLWHRLVTAVRSVCDRVPRPSALRNLLQFACCNLLRSVYGGIKEASNGKFSVL